MMRDSLNSRIHPAQSNVAWRRHRVGHHEVASPSLFVCATSWCFGSKKLLKRASSPREEKEWTKWTIVLQLQRRGEWLPNVNIGYKCWITSKFGLTPSKFGLTPSKYGWIPSKFAWIPSKCWITSKFGFTPNKYGWIPGKFWLDTKQIWLDTRQIWSDTKQICWIPASALWCRKFMISYFVNKAPRGSENHDEVAQAHPCVLLHIYRPKGRDGLYLCLYHTLYRWVWPLGILCQRYRTVAQTQKTKKSKYCQNVDKAHFSVATVRNPHTDTSQRKR